VRAGRQRSPKRPSGSDTAGARTTTLHRDRRVAVRPQRARRCRVTTNDAYLEPARERET
jgi:hypothetical protein